MVPAAPRFVAYYRVSTDRQGRSGLGLDAQRAAVAKYVAGAGGVVAAEFEEVESGKRTDRPQLAAALAACRARRAALVIAKLDRLARNARFLLHVVEGTGEAGVVFCDLPSVPPGPVGKFLVLPRLPCRCFRVMRRAGRAPEAGRSLLGRTWIV